MIGCCYYYFVFLYFPFFCSHSLFSGGKFFVCKIWLIGERDRAGILGLCEMRNSSPRKYYLVRPLLLLLLLLVLFSLLSNECWMWACNHETIHIHINNIQFKAHRIAIAIQIQGNHNFSLWIWIIKKKRVKYTMPQLKHNYSYSCGPYIYNIFVLFFLFFQEKTNRS